MTERTKRQASAFMSIMALIRLFHCSLQRLSFNKQPRQDTSVPSQQTSFVRLLAYSSSNYSSCYSYITFFYFSCSTTSKLKVYSSSNIPFLLYLVLYLLNKNHSVNWTNKILCNLGLGFRTHTVFVIFWLTKTFAGK